MWLRHSVTEWHLDCEIYGDERHDYIAAIETTPDGDLILLVPTSPNEIKKKKFSSISNLNGYISRIGLEECNLQP